MDSDTAAMQPSTAKQGRLVIIRSSPRTPHE
jgi:hypothetical protein